MHTYHQKIIHIFIPKNTVSPRYPTPSFAAP